jgi:hypothetical protein
MRQNQSEMIDRLDRALAPDYRLMPLHRPGSPVFLAVAMPSTDGVSGLKPRLPAGRGLTLPQAMIAAGAEAVELRSSLARSHLPMLADSPRLDGLVHVTTRDMASGAAVALPAQAVFLDCAELLAEPMLQDANRQAAPQVRPPMRRRRQPCGNVSNATPWRCGGMAAGVPGRCLSR